MMRLFGSSAPSAGAGPDTGQPAFRLKKRIVVAREMESFFGRPGAIVTLMAGGRVVSFAAVESVFVLSIATESVAARVLSGLACCTGGVSAATTPRATNPATLSRHERPVDETSPAVVSACASGSRPQAAIATSAAEKTRRGVRCDDIY